MNVKLISTNNVKWSLGRPINRWLDKLAYGISKLEDKSGSGRRKRRIKKSNSDVTPSLLDVVSEFVGCQYVEVDVCAADVT